MNFCFIRLGKDSTDEIYHLDAMKGLQQRGIPVNIVCRQVPGEVSNGTFCFVWLGSDNNKGLPTNWKQGLRAFGVVQEKGGGPRHNDDWTLKLKISFVFSSSINKFDLYRSSPVLYEKISEMPIIGLSTSSNQTVQLIRIDEPGQDVGVLFRMLDLLDTGFMASLKSLRLVPDFVFENRKKIKINPELTFEPPLVKQITETSENDKNDFDETEDKGTATITHPFDPTKIDIRPQPLTIISILRRLESNPIRLDLDTEFQRTANLWTPVNQSRLIESLLVRIPLPAFYFDGTVDKWLIVDGLQRISTLRNFIIEKSEKRLKLSGLEYLNEFEGFGWDDLPPYLKSRIEETAVTAYIINPGTPEEVKFNIFKRINTGGLSLTPQEIRNALNHGVPSRFVSKMAGEDLFIKAMGGKVPKERMQDKDYVTRFLGFYLDEEKYQPDLDTFLNAGMSKLKTKSEDDLEVILADFNKAMKFANSILGENAFRKRNAANRRMPINKALFECTSVIFAKFKYSELLILESKRDIVNQRLMELLTKNDEFIHSISSGTGDLKSVQKRYSILRTFFNSIMYDKSAAS